jgi:hypothetical protein
MEISNLNVFLDLYELHVDLWLAILDGFWIWNSVQSMIALIFSTPLRSFGFWTPSRSAVVVNGNKNCNSLLKNNNQVMNILLPVPVDIQNRSDNITILGFLCSLIRVNINCSFKGNLVNAYFCWK